MLNFDRQNALVIALVGLLAVLALFLFTGRARLADLRREKAQIEQRIASLQEEDRRAKVEMARLRDDPAFLEQTVRDELRLVRDGEMVFVFGTEPDRAK